MKPHVQFLLTLAALAPATWLGEFLGLPLFVTMLVMFLAQTWLVFEYNTRAMLRPRPIPERGYDRRREALERDESLIFNLGFVKADEFYLKSISDAVVYVYEHRSEPVALWAYHAGVKSFCDFVTRFEGDVTLTTTSGSSAGTIRRPPRRLAQVYKDLDHRQMFEAHARAVAFASRHGLRPERIPAASLRESFVGSVKEFNERWRSDRLFLLRFLGGMATGAGQDYRKPLEKQYPSGLTPEALAG